MREAELASLKVPVHGVRRVARRPHPGCTSSHRETSCCKTEAPVPSINAGAPSAFVTACPSTSGQEAFAQAAVAQLS
jgi:hypothetical protein